MNQVGSSNTAISFSNPARRSFLALTAAAATTLLARSATAAPAVTLDASKASPALRSAVVDLRESHESLEAAKAIFNEADMKMAAWDNDNPQPAGKRAYKRWARRFHDAREAIVGESWDAQIDAERHFEAAQMAVARIKPADMNELCLMAAVGAVYDKTHLARGQQALISYGVSLGLIALQLPRV
jgi:hypothetical protein